MADRIRHWTERLARHRTGLAALSFAESTVVPIPLEAVVAPLMVGHHRQSLTIALAIWVGCLVGASVFYFFGLWAFDPIVRPILDWLGLLPTLESLTDDLDRQGLFWSVFLVSFSPAPMQLATLGAGSIGGNFAVFFAAIAASRGLRYFGLAVLARLVGPQIAELNIPKGRIMLAVLGAGLVIWGASQVL